MCNSRPSGFHPFNHPVHFSLLYLAPCWLDLYPERIESRDLRFHAAMLVLSLSQKVLIGFKSGEEGG